MTVSGQRGELRDELANPDCFSSSGCSDGAQRD